MDWLPDSDLFIAPNNFDLFDYEFEVRNEGQECKVIQNWGLEAAQGAEMIDLMDHESWLNWMKRLSFVLKDEKNEDGFTVQLLPKDGFSILFVPRAKDIALIDKYQPCDYTDLPLDDDSWRNWRKVVEAFHLPGHFPKLVARKQTSVTSIARTHMFPEGPEKLWMHTAVTNPSFNENAFALAATHFESRNLTLAIMFSCSDEQINSIRGLVDTWKDAIGHPLLMLGIYAELQLDRLVAIVNTRYEEYEKLIEEVELEPDKKGKDRFSWEMIKKVRLSRELSKKVEEEVRTTKHQLSKARSSALRALKSSGRLTETTNLFSERFDDIVTRIDGLCARCRIMFEGISFTTDIIRSEISRQEAQSGAETSKFATGNSLVAMIYLPLTTMATIFAMPIFQWSHDWRDWRYRPVDSDDTSTSDSNAEDSSNGMVSPVISGYIWLYLSISAGLTLITYFSFRFYMRPGDPDNSESPPTSKHNNLFLRFIRPLQQTLSLCIPRNKQNDESHDDERSPPQRINSSLSLNGRASNNLEVTTVTGPSSMLGSDLMIPNQSKGKPLLGEEQLIPLQRLSPQSSSSLTVQPDALHGSSVLPVSTTAGSRTLVPQGGGDNVQDRVTLEEKRRVESENEHNKV